MVLIQSGLNYVAILVSAIAAMIFGMFWYSPKTFGMQWMKLSGIKKKDPKNMGMKMLIAFVAEIIVAFFLASVIILSGATTFMEALGIGFGIWLGFVATITIGSTLWEGKPMELFVLNNGHNLIKFLIMSVILTLWV